MSSRGRRRLRATRTTSAIDASGTLGVVKQRIYGGVVSVGVFCALVGRVTGAASGDLDPQRVFGRLRIYAGQARNKGGAARTENATASGNVHRSGRAARR